MKNLLIVTVLIACAALFAGCAAPAPKEVAAPEPVVEPVVEPAPELVMVEVSAEGTEFDPPVAVEQIPVGSWYCGMETVHYARTEEGDATCPVCNMNLVQKTADEVVGEPMSDAEIEAATTSGENVDEPMPDAEIETAATN